MNTRLIRVTMLLGIVALVSSCKEKEQVSAPTARQDVTPSNSSGTPLNERLTSQAWGAFNEEDYDTAIRHADACIGEFLGGARRKQRQLRDQNADEPPIGAVSDGQKKAVFEQGLINDVATCLYIKGRANEALGHKQEAIEAYKAASELTYARCWDPQGWFWSPSEASQDRLGMLD